MWASRDGTIFEFGGFLLLWPPQVPERSTIVSITRQYAVWSFKPTSKEWGLVQTNGDDIDRVSSAAHASALEPGPAFRWGRRHDRTPLVRE